MNPEIKARWLTALRDPDTIQGRGALGRTDKSRCCLGVLCDIAVTDGVIQPPSRDLYHIDVLRYDGHTGCLPPKVVSWAGLDEMDPEVDFRRLSSFNDSGVLFVRIADMIEEHL